jgi:hypothetical protein
LLIGRTLLASATRMGAALLICLAGAPSTATAQIGATTDIITGTVRAENGVPIKDATVEVTSLETSVTRRARTNAQGRYTILFPDGGGEYHVVIRAIGLAPATSELRRVADEDRLVADATLTQNATRLSTVAVEGRQTPRAGQDLPTPGSVERAFTPEQVARLPIDASDLLNLALLSPQVVSIGASDSSAAGFSVGGLRPEANAVTLDGLSFGSTEIPSEATRSTRVITSTYDVTRGQFSGGQIASTTRSGTNVLQGNFSYRCAPTSKCSRATRNLRSRRDTRRTSSAAASAVRSSRTGSSASCPRNCAGARTSCRRSSTRMRERSRDSA